MPHYSSTQPTTTEDEEGLLEELKRDIDSFVTSDEREEFESGAPQPHYTAEGEMPEGYEEALGALGSGPEAEAEVIRQWATVATPHPTWAVAERDRPQTNHCVKIRSWADTSPPFGPKKKGKAKQVRRKKKRAKERQEKRAARWGKLEKTRLPPPGRSSGLLRVPSQVIRGKWSTDSSEWLAGTGRGGRRFHTW
jgi:hypothetical protein